MKKLTKAILSSLLFIFSLLIVTACSNKSSESSSIPTSTPTVTTTSGVVEEGVYQTKEINFYREKDKVDRKISLRFYNDTPTIPYVGIKQYFKEFYKTDIKTTQNGYTYTFERGTGYINLKTDSDIFKIVGIDNLSIHPDSRESNSTTYLKALSTNSTTIIPKIIDLSDYKINTYGSDEEAYVPLTFLANIVTGTTLFTICYNGEALYEFDYAGILLNGEKRTEDYYGDSYLAPILSNSERSQDMVDFSYNLICLLIDNFRGYTTQMAFIDNNVLSLGLNGTLEQHYPKIKANLLSKNKREYAAGISALFVGLGDGGHTGLVSSIINKMFVGQDTIADLYDKDSPEIKLVYQVTYDQIASLRNSANRVNLKKQAFNLEDISSYYHLVSDKKMAYLGFNSFKVNYDAWDKYYKAIAKGEKGEVPLEGDTFSFVRSKLYQALEDKVEYLVLDLSTNGGGDSTALSGIVGLLHRANSTMAFNDTVNHFRIEQKYAVDINLDGKYDELDEKEALKFQDMNIVILTSKQAFSCGNLLPSLLKEFGYHTIGEQTGGGSCAIMIGSMPDGPYYIRSSYSCLSNEAGNNIDSGVPVDVNLLGEPDTSSGYKLNNYEKFYNFDEVYKTVKELFGN